jgi:hypothetical protein
MENKNQVPSPRSITRTPIAQPGILSSRRLAVGGALTLLLAGSVSAASSNLTWNAAATIKETYDDNVYLQDVQPSPANVASAAAAGLTAAHAHKSSWLTTISPRVGLNYANDDASFKLQAGYAPEIALYESAEDEDYITHRTTLNFSGHVKDATWELLNSPTFIQGSTTGPVFARPGDCPAIGGVPLRNRREAFIFINSFRVTLPFDNWFVRPAASSYYHDFFTDQRPSGAGYLYENYIDRQDVNGGLDVGYDVGRKTYLILGYRYGRQDQGKLLGANSRYDSTYHRILIGVEGSPAPWIKLALLGGPEIRDWRDSTPAGFDRNAPTYWIDAKVTLLPTQSDTIVLFHHSYQQPAFASQTVYQDITSSVTWTHKFNAHISANAGMQLYIGDWESLATRDDWIYTPSFGLTYAYNQHLSAEFSFSRDWAENYQSGLPYGAGRDFTRDLFSLSVKYVF